MEWSASQGVGPLPVRMTYATGWGHAGVEWDAWPRGVCVRVILQL